MTLVLLLQGYGDIAYQACTIVGGTAGSATVSGTDYVSIVLRVWTPSRD
jgi:hypothetical protein